LNREAPDRSRIRVSALHGEAAVWKDIGQRERSQAATILADAEPLAPTASPAFLVEAMLKPEGATFPRVSGSPTLAEARASGSVEVYVQSPRGHGVAEVIARYLELLHTGAPLRRAEQTVDTLAALAPPLPPPPPSSPPPPATEVASSAPSAPSAPAAPKVDIAARLHRLDELRSQKLINEAEYQRERARILKEGL
jgi:hypothetical protein